MSTPQFLLAALLMGLLVFVLGWAFGRLIDPLFGFDARRARLYRRRAVRIGRGTDLYFEELRSLDASLAQLEVQAARPRQNWLARPLVLLLPFVLLSFGAFALGLFAQPLGLGAPPAWFDLIPPAAWLLLGLRYLIDPATVDTGGFGTARGLGFFFVGLAAFHLVIKFI